MYHSVTIGDKNTWDDWHLIAKIRPYFAPPTVKTKYIEVPGSSGSLDLSEALTGYPLYNNREGSIEFTILNAEDVSDDYEYKYNRWIDLYSEIMNSINGKTLRAVLEDEPNYYYEGKFWVSGYKPGSSAQETRGTITISYNLNPFKWENISSIDPWIWDTFDFNTGVIYSKIFNAIEIQAEQEYKIEYRKAPILAAVRPEIIVEDYPVYVGFENHTLGIIIEPRKFDVGTTIAHDFIIYGNAFDINIVGTESITNDENEEEDTVTSKVSINFKIGRL